MNPEYVIDLMLHHEVYFLPWTILSLSATSCMKFKIFLLYDDMIYSVYSYEGLIVFVSADWHVNILGSLEDVIKL